MKIQNVEVLRTGTWNGTKFTAEHLREIVTNFSKKPWDVPVKLGHDHSPSAPAYGWVTGLRMVGDKLLADFSDVPQAVVDMVKAKQFRHVSIELVGNLTRAGVNYRRALSAVALLGAKIPAVQGLKPVSDSLEQFDDGELLAFELDFSVSDEPIISLPVALLETLDHNLATEAREAGHAAAHYPIGSMPQALISGLQKKHQLVDLNDEALLKKLGEAISDDAIVCSLSKDAAAKALFERVTGRKPTNPKQETDMSLVKLLSQAVEQRAKAKKIGADAVAADMAKVAGIELEQFNQLLKGENVELTDEQFSGLYSAMSAADEAESTIAELQQQVDALKAASDGDEANRQRIAELEQKLNNLEEKAQADEAEQVVLSCKIPALRRYLRPLMRAAASHEPKVKLFSQDGTSSEDSTAVDVVRGLVKEINGATKSLFTEQSQTTDSDDEYAASIEDAGNKLDELTQKALAKDSKLDYAAAFEQVMQANPELAKAYNAGAH